MPVTVTSAILNRTVQLSTVVQRNRPVTVTVTVTTPLPTCGCEMDFVFRPDHPPSGGCTTSNIFASFFWLLLANSSVLQKIYSLPSLSVGPTGPRSFQSRKRQQRHDSADNFTSGRQETLCSKIDPLYCCVARERNRTYYVRTTVRGGATVFYDFRPLQRIGPDQ